MNIKSEGNGLVVTNKYQLWLVSRAQLVVCSCLSIEHFILVLSKYHTTIGAFEKLSNLLKWKSSDNTVNLIGELFEWQSFYGMNICSNTMCFGVNKLSQKTFSETVSSFVSLQIKKNDGNEQSIGIEHDVFNFIL